jgi:predicted RNA-binding Zn ribbon-like protein
MAPGMRVTAALRAQRFDAGSLALNLMASVGRRGSRRIERMPDTASLRSWCARCGLAIEQGVDEDDLLEQLRRLREHAYALTSAVLRAEAVDERDLAAINARASLSPPTPCLVASNGGVELAVAPLSTDAVLSVIARDLVRVLGDPGLRARLRECHSQDCRMIYLAPEGREQRWCSMAACGNRAKAAARRARTTRTAEQTAPGSEGSRRDAH